MSEPLNGLSKAYYDIGAVIEGKTLTGQEVLALANLLVRSQRPPVLKEPPVV